MKHYAAKGKAGCVEQKRCRATGHLVGLYHAEQAELEEDLEHPWAVVCEAHGTILRTQSMRLARQHMARPFWCEDCAAEANL